MIKFGKLYKKKSDVIAIEIPEYIIVLGEYTNKSMPNKYVFVDIADNIEYCISPRWIMDTYEECSNRVEQE